MTREAAGDAFVRNLVAFGRVLRRAGIAVAPEQIADVAQALTLVGVDDRDRVRRAARALLVKRREDVSPFDLLFDSFWRHPEGPQPRRARAPARPDRAAAGRFTIASWAAHRDRLELPRVDVTDRAGTWSDTEVIQSKAFSEMTPGELDAVRRLMEALRFELPERITRRRVADASGDAIDLRRVLRETARLGAVPARVPRRSRAVRLRPIN